MSRMSLQGAAIAPQSLADRFPGLDFDDIHEAGWSVMNYDHNGSGWAMTFNKGEDSVTTAGEDAPAALHNFRKYLWREGLLAPVNAASPDDIRAQGWKVAVHNDYVLGGRDMTFWGFSRGNRWIRGEGETDAEALDKVRQQIRELGAQP